MVYVVPFATNVFDNPMLILVYASTFHKARLFKYPIWLGTVNGWSGVNDMVWARVSVRVVVKVSKMLVRC